MGFSLALAKSVAAAPSLDHGKKVRYMMHACSNMLQTFYTNDLNRENYENAVTVVENAVQVVTQYDPLLAILEGLKSQSDAQFAHGLGVSMFSTLIAQEIGWKSKRTQCKISIAGLLHDAGKKEINKEIVNKPRATLTAEEAKELQLHTVRGMEIMTNVRGIPEEIVQVALQHHEDCVGTGYPYRLTKNRIIPIARLVKVADEFCHHVMPNDGGAPLGYKEALSKLLQTAENRLDQEYVSGLVSLFAKKDAPK